MATHTEGLSTVKEACYTIYREIETRVSEKSKRISIFLSVWKRVHCKAKASEFLILDWGDHGELGQNLKAQTRPPGAKSEPGMIGL